MNRQSVAYGMTALALVQNEGVMSSPLDVMVIGGQVIAERQQNNPDRYVFNHLAHTKL